VTLDTSEAVQHGPEVLKLNAIAADRWGSGGAGLWAATAPIGLTGAAAHAQLTWRALLASGHPRTACHTNEVS